MHIIPATDRANFTKTIKNIDSWELAVLPWVHYDEPSYSDYCSAECSFWLGHSSNHKEWALASIPWSIDYDEVIPIETFYAACNAILVDPPKIQEDAIFSILFLVYSELKKANWITKETINEIFSAVPFSEYLNAETHLPELPKEWLHLPVGLCVDFDLSENFCAPPFIFREYKRNLLKEAVEVVYGTRLGGLLIYYFLVVQKMIPFLAWNVDWPLSRRGKNLPYKREKVGGTFPWEELPDQSLLTLYQWAPLRGTALTPDAYALPSIRLIVGGRSQKEAIFNWHQCAKALRKFKPKTLWAEYEN